MHLLSLSEVCWDDPNKSAFERSQEPIQCRCKQKNTRTAHQTWLFIWHNYPPTYFVPGKCSVKCRRVISTLLEDTESCRHSLICTGEMFHLKTSGQYLFNHPDSKPTAVWLTLFIIRAIFAYDEPKHYEQLQVKWISLIIS